MQTACRLVHWHVHKLSSLGVETPETDQRYWHLPCGKGQAKQEAGRRGQSMQLPAAINRVLTRIDSLEGTVPHTHTHTHTHTNNTNTPFVVITPAPLPVCPHTFSVSMLRLNNSAINLMLPTLRFRCFASRRARSSGSSGKQTNR